MEVSSIEIVIIRKQASARATDISTFVVAVIGQLLSYKLLMYRKLPGNFNRVSLIALILLGLVFVLFPFYPPQLSIFKDPITGRYGLPQ
jgi:amino acid permease